MQGVEILTSAQVVAEMAWNPTVFWITAIIVFFIFFITGIFVSRNTMNFTPFVVCIIVGAIMSCGLGASMGAAFYTPTTYETQYKVTISDEVSMTEFYEHYEVIEQNGKIFTVREKTNEYN